MGWGLVGIHLMTMGWVNILTIKLGVGANHEELQ